MISCCSVLNVWAKDNSSSNVAQRRQKVGHPWVGSVRTEIIAFRVTGVEGDGRHLLRK